MAFETCPEIDPKDVFTVIDFEMDQDKLIRGQTPDGIEEKCLQLCRDFIGNHWSKLTIKEVKVQRITGGLVNQFYRVTIPDCQIEPNDVGIKIYQDKLFPDKSFAGRESDIIVLKAISDLGIGPKIYGLSNNVAIFDFIESESFGVEHQKNEKIVRELLKKLATFHHMNLPLIKNGTFPQQYMENAFDKAYDKLHLKEIAQEMNLKYLGNMCLRHEHSAITDILDNKIKPQKVFCHNDFRSLNILVSKKNSRVYFCDVETSTYGYRPLDLCTVLFEWGVGVFRYRIPSEDEIKNVCQIYIEECNKIVPGYSLKPENSLEQLMREIKVLFLRFYLFIIAFFVEKDESFPDTEPFDYKKNVEISERGMEFYVQAKNKFIQQGVIEPF